MLSCPTPYLDPVRSSVAFRPRACEFASAGSVSYFYTKGKETRRGREGESGIVVKSSSQNCGGRGAAVSAKIYCMSMKVGECLGWKL